MTKYECGHETNGIIILEDSIMSMTAYIQWAEEEKNLETRKECFDCFLKKISESQGNTSNTVNKNHSQGQKGVKSAVSFKEAKAIVPDTSKSKEKKQ